MKRLATSKFRIVLIMITTLASLISCGNTPQVSTSTSLAPTSLPTVAPSPTPTTGNVSGKVYRSDTNFTYANAVVELTEPESGNPIAEAKTDSKGIYKFSEIKPGTYAMRASLYFNSINELPCEIMIIEVSKDERWMLTGGQQKDTGKLVLIAISNKSEGNEWKTRTTDLKSGDNLTEDIDLRCKK